jgi:hypothetical protein
VDTVIQGKRYIGSLSDNLYRTNGKDSVWYYDLSSGDLPYRREGFGGAAPYMTEVFGDSVWQMDYNPGFYYYSYTDKFGLIRSDCDWAHEPSAYDLLGCVIQGKVYGKVTKVEASMSPTDPSLVHLQSYPNPFSRSATVVFSIPTTEIVDIALFNVAGIRVAELMHRSMTAGSHEFNFGSGLAPGVYCCVVRSGKLLSTNLVTVVP